MSGHTFADADRAEGRRMTGGDDRPHVDTIVRSLNARPNGTGWRANCPAHADRKPSLGITMNDAGRVNLKCHAGCDSDDVLRALGLTVADLYPAGSLAPRRWELMRNPHVYDDATGRPLYAIHRFKPGQGAPKFLPYRPDGSTGLPEERVLYRLPMLLAESPRTPVFICEGEHDADVLANHFGLITTTVASGTWKGVDTSPLAGRRVIVVVDNDRAGWSRGLRALDAAADAGAIFDFTDYVWRPPDQYHDAADAIRHGLGCDDFLKDVDLYAEEPPVESWEDNDKPAPSRRPILASNGQAQGVRVPFGVFAAHAEADDLDLKSDLALWTFMEDRAFMDTHECTASASEIADVLGWHRTTVEKSRQRLAEVGLVRKVKKGRWLVLNPTHPHRHGDVNTSGTYRNAAAQPTIYNPSTSTSPVRPQGMTSKSDIQQHANRHSESRMTSKSDIQKHDTGADREQATA